MVSTASEPALVDDRRARKNVLILAVAQAIGGSMISINITLGGLTGVYLLREMPELATLPVTFMIVGTACGTVPAALLMGRFGRRPGFMLGTLLGMTGGLVACAGILWGLFPVLCLGTFIKGTAFAFAQQYRFAAADTASPAFRPKAISWVLGGGLAAGIIGPQTVILARDAFAPIEFAGAYLASAGLNVIAFVVLAFLDIPNVRRTASSPKGRPIMEILAEPRIRRAIVVALVSYAVMSLMMTAAPLAIVACGFTTEQAALGIQWHVLAMYAPSFVTGSIIARYGAARVASVGLALLAIAAVIALSGLTLANFWGALILLGLGWNFGFLGGTAMLTENQRPEERARLQAANDFLVFGSVAVASLSSGILFEGLGWAAIGWLILPLVAVTFAVVVALARQRPHAAA